MHFLLKFISLADACTFISANHIIYNIGGYFKQIDKKMQSSLLLKFFYFIFTIFLKNIRKQSSVNKFIQYF